MANRGSRKVLGPKAVIGQKVEVLNWRRSPGVWEPAVVVGGGVGCSMFWWTRTSGPRWSYTAELSRRSAAGRGIRLEVNDDQLRTVEEVEHG